jgi:hypothetical protein
MSSKRKLNAYSIKPAGFKAEQPEVLGTKPCSINEVAIARLGVKMDFLGEECLYAKFRNQ